MSTKSSAWQRQPAGARHLLVAAVAGLALQVLWTGAMLALEARQTGMAPLAALASVGHAMLVVVPAAAAVWGVLAAVVLLSLRLWPGTTNAPSSPGERRARWAQQRPWEIALYVVGLSVLGALLLVAWVTGTWRGWHGVVLGAFLYFAQSLIVRLACRPSPERLYEMETGDDSRLNDERMQEVQKRSAQTSLVAIVVLLLVGGLLYETVFLAVWPVGTLAGVVAIPTVWWAMTVYWNQKL